MCEGSRLYGTAKLPPMPSPFPRRTRPAAFVAGHAVWYMPRVNTGDGEGTPSDFPRSHRRRRRSAPTGRVSVTCEPRPYSGPQTTNDRNPGSVTGARTGHQK